MRLQRHDWVRAGLRTLADAGFDAVRIEVLARSLNVSKGSFYWHFNDREELLSAILDQWERQQMSWVLAKSHEDTPVARKLTRLFGLMAATASGPSVAAIHAWARRDPKVAARVAAVERERVNWMARLFRELGFESSEAQGRADIAHLIYLGWVDRVGRQPEIRRLAGALAQHVARLLIGEAPD